MLNLESEPVIDFIPQQVLEAFETLLEVARIIVEEANPDDTIREAIFTKIPRERIEAALAVIREWDESLDQGEDAPSQSPLVPWD